MPTFKRPSFEPGVQLDQTRTNYYVHAGPAFEVTPSGVDLVCDAQGDGAVPEPPGAAYWDPDAGRVFAPEGRDIDVFVRLGVVKTSTTTPRRIRYTLDIGPEGSPVVIDEGDVEAQRNVLIGGLRRPRIALPPLFAGPTFAANGLRITLSTDRGALSCAESEVRVRTLP